MSLQTLYQELHRRAKESGEKRGQTLTGGARLTVRVRAAGGSELGVRDSELGVRNSEFGDGAALTNPEPRIPNSENESRTPNTVILTISRKGKLVGETELATFRAACNVPETAERRPPTGQNRMEHDKETWYYLSFRWTETPQ